MLSIIQPNIHDTEPTPTQSHPIGGIALAHVDKKMSLVYIICNKFP